MRRFGYKLVGAFAGLLAIGAFTPAPALGAEKMKVGVLLWTDEPRYRDAAEESIKQLKVEGFGDAAVTIETKSAKGDKKAAAAIAKEFAAGGVRAILVMGTGATAAAMEVVKETPIVFSVVWDPVEAGFAKSWSASSSEPKTAGTADATCLPCLSTSRQCRT